MTITNTSAVARWARTTTACALALCCALAPTITPVATADKDNTGMVQNIAADEQFAPLGTPVTITQGHIDIGPIMVNDSLELLFRDDSAATPVWRHFSDATFVLDSRAENVLPDSGDYDFTGAAPGATVWAVPQNQVAGVPWLGWTTQSPSIVDMFTTGMTFSFGPHTGPGQASLFVQSGGFGGPQVFYTSDNPQPQTIFVDMRTHTHLNWVFTEPGRHTVGLGVSGTTAQGDTQHASATITFLVGDGNPAAPHDAGAGEADLPAATTTVMASATQPPTTQAAHPATDMVSDTPTGAPAAEDTTVTRSSGVSATTWLIFGGLVLVALFFLVGAIIVRRRRAADEVFHSAGDNS